MARINIVRPFSKRHSAAHNSLIGETFTDKEVTLRMLISTCGVTTFELLSLLWYIATPPPLTLCGLYLTMQLKLGMLCSYSFSYQVSERIKMFARCVT